MRRRVNKFSAFAEIHRNSTDSVAGPNSKIVEFTIYKFKKLEKYVKN
jgi:hypothetical protein